MEKYFCNCLNVIINVNNKETRESVGKDLILESPENVDIFFGGKLLDVRLSISGIEVSQPALKFKRSYGDWLVYSCLNCGIDTHAMHATKGVDRVFLSDKIPHGEGLLENFKENSSYSKSLNIIIIPHADRAKINENLLGAVSVQQASEKLNNSCKKLIQAEEDAKNERIRIFTQKENQQFREFKMKASQDKEKLIQNLRHLDPSKSPLDIDENYFNASLLEHRSSFTEVQESRKNPKPAFSLFASKDSGSMLDSPEFEAENVISQSVPATFGLSGMSGLSQRISNSNKGKVKKSSEKKHSSHNDDILFDMEGYNNERNIEPFYESDEESSGDATSLESSGGFSGSRGITMSASSKRDSSRSASQNFACSMPVAVPLFHNTRQPYDPESEDEEEKVSSPSLSRLAISFKQVAKSMQDSTGMFGDLPRRRTEHSSFCHTDNFMTK